jgi:hypothetical protein
MPRAPREGDAGKSGPQGRRPAGGRASGPAATRASAGRPGGKRRPPPRPNNTGAIVLVATFAAVIVALILVKVLMHQAPTRSSLASYDNKPVPASLLRAVTVPPTVKVPDSAYPLPAVLKTPAWYVGKKPVLMYIGAEYCPYCAAFRWALITTLKRFGTLTDMHYMTSSTYPTEPYRGTATFTFYKSHYTSPYIDFQFAEETTNKVGYVKGVGETYLPLMTPTKTQNQRFTSVANATYFPGTSVDGIPFVNLAGTYAWMGATVNAALVHGHTWSQLVADLANPTSPVTVSVAADANILTAAICKVDGMKPASACQLPGVRAALAKLPPPAHPTP